MPNGVNDLNAEMMPQLEALRLLDLSLDLACVVGKNGRFQWVNAAFSRTLGWTHDALQHMLFIELIHPQDKDRFLANVASLFRQKPVADLECRLRLTDGSYRWFSWRVEGFPHGGMQAVLRDVTELRRQTAVQDKHYMQTLYQITSQPHTTPNDVAIIRALEEAAQVLELSTGLVSRVVDQAYHVQYVTAGSDIQPGQQYRLGDTFCDLTMTSEDVVAIHHAQKSSHNRHPCYLLRKLEAYIGVVLRVNGEPYGALNFSSSQPHRPFTAIEKSFVEVLARWVEARLEQAQHLQQMATANAIQNAVVEYAGYAIVVTDANGVIQLFNPSAEVMLGYAAAEMVGQQPLTVLHTSAELAQRAQLFSQELGVTLRPGVDALVARARQGLPNLFKWTYVGKNGRFIPVYLNITALRDDQNDITGYLCIASDAAEQQQAQQFQHLQMQLASFSAAVGQALTRSVSLQAMLQATAEAMVQHLETAVARIWTLDKQADSLRLQASAGLPPDLDDSYSTIAIGQGEIGQIAQTKQPYFTSDVVHDDLFGDTSWVASERLHSFIGYPLLIDDELVGVAGLFSHRPLSEVIVQALAGAAQSVALSIHRDQVEQALRRTRDELEMEVVKRTTELSEKNVLLQSQISERDETNIILRKRAAELEIVTRVSATSSAIADTDRLMQEVVDLIKFSFDLYHAHFYVLNDVGDALVLSIGAGEVGRMLLEKGYTILLTQPNSLVARAALTKRGVIENDLYAAPGYLANPLLPESRSSMAIPMIVGDEVLGVLNVQSDVVNHFTDEDVRIQTTLASQIALALQHTRSLERAQTAIDRLNNLTRRLSWEGWADYLAEQDQPHLGYGYDLVQTRPTHNGLLPETAARQVVKHRLSVQGNEIGELLLADPQEFAEDVDDILHEVAEQLTAHIETLRLSEQMRGVLSRTEALYASSDQIVRSGSSAEVLSALVASVGVDQFVSASLLFFDRPWGHSRPDYMRAAAVWTHPAAALTMVPEGSVFSFSRFPSLQQLRRNEPTLLNDVVEDGQVGNDLRSLLAEQLGVRGVAFFPLVAGQEWFGIFAGLTLDVLSLGEEKVRQLRSLTDQAAAVVQNLRLYEQTQAALAQTEALYQISTYLNAAVDLDDIAQAVSVPSMSTGMTWTGIWLLERDEEKRPFSLALAGCWSSRERTPVPVGTAMRVSEMDFPELLSDVVNPAPVFLSDLQHERVKLLPEAYGLVQRQGFQSGIILPVRYGDNVLGLATVAWDVAHQFEEADKSLYRLLTSQLGVAVHSQLLLRDSRHRSEQLEKLARIEAGLSSANTEDDIVAAVVGPLALVEGTQVALSYLDVNARDNTIWERLVSFWRDDTFLPAQVSAASLQLLSENVLAPLWLGQTDEMFFLSNVATDQRLTETMRDHVEREGWQAMALLPLRSGGRWQGLLRFLWAAPHRLTDDERFLLSRLLEPVAATVASRRAFLAQLAARQEMSELYEASRRLNEAADLQELLESVVVSVSIDDISRANLWLFPPTDVVAKRAQLLAAWSGDPDRPALPVGTLLAEGEDGFVAFLRQTDSRFVANVVDDFGVPESVRVFSVERNVASLVILPLIVQGERRGVIVLSAQRPHVYSEREQRICRSLMPQIAIVLENKRLLEAAQARAERERLLREVTERVRRSLNVETVMKTAVEEVGRVLGRRTVIYLEDSQQD